MLDIDQTALAVIDVQGKLAGLVCEYEKILAEIQRVIRAGSLFHLPILLSEQVPHKIGVTVEPIRALLPDNVKPMPKTTMSCYGCSEFVDQLQRTNRRQILLVGIETHVCIYQTARDLYAHGYQVHLISDAVSSRHAFDHHAAIGRMRQEGIIITTTEMAICELLKTSEHPKFREIMGHIKR